MNCWLLMEILNHSAPRVVWSSTGQLLQPEEECLTSSVLCMSLFDLVCNVRGMKSKGCFGDLWRMWGLPLVLLEGPLKGPREAEGDRGEPGSHMQTDNWQHSCSTCGNQELSVCSKAEGERLFKVSMLTSQIVTSLMLFNEGLANKFRQRMKMLAH